MRSFASAIFLMLIFTHAVGAEELPANVSSSSRDLVESARQPIKFRIRPGNEAETSAYYNRISRILKFDFKNSSLDSFLSHLGYSKHVFYSAADYFEGLLAEDLERIASFELMPRDNSEFDRLANKVLDQVAFRELFELNDFTSDQILASRFFAPKIATYFSPIDPYLPIEKKDIIPGWRKLIRLTPQSGSTAESVGKIAHIYLLFNYKKADTTVDPFEGNISANNQVIIVPKDLTEGDRAFFLVYQGRNEGYEIGTFLAADFDLPGHASKNISIKVAGGSDGRYFVPRSCAECHGHSIRDAAGNQLAGEPVDASTGVMTTDFGKGVYKFAKPNYLDTDQWYDWLNYDYPTVAASNNDVIFDGGKDHNSAEYKRAFEVIRKLNNTILKETEAAELNPTAASFQTLAAEKWIEIHQSTDLPQDISRRSIGVEDWDTNNADERRLLNLLNNHCFRCHSSVRYNIFDKAAVKRRKFLMFGFLERPVKDDNGNILAGFFMPQGRVLTDTERSELKNLLLSVLP